MQAAVGISILLTLIASFPREPVLCKDDRRSCVQVRAAIVSVGVEPWCDCVVCAASDAHVSMGL
jgi:hypothetical protein